MYRPKFVKGLYGEFENYKCRNEEEIEIKAAEILARMELDEKIAQMSGDKPLARGLVVDMFKYNIFPYPAGENFRLGIPGIRFSDGPRGVVMYSSTCFPCAMARGASWDAELEEKVGDAIAVEARSQGANFFGGVCINLLRHPAWGRAQESYGEDPHHLGEMGAALVRGVQRHIMACVKHFACNSMENSRFRVDVRAGKRALHEIYLPHFKRCIDEGAAAVMSAYNKVNGHHCGHSRELLGDILRDKWGFKGFVMSDFIFGIRSAEKAALAGLDIEMPNRMHYRFGLKRKVLSGRVPESVIDASVMNILRQKLRFSSVGKAGSYGKEKVLCREHIELAARAAAESMVLLKNRPLESGIPLLPLDPARVRSIAVIGKLAKMGNTGDRGSSMVRPPYVVTPFEGIKKAAESHGIKVKYSNGRSVRAAKRLAAQCDAVIIVAGYTHSDEGEYIFWKGGDRKRLTLRKHDEKLINCAASINPATAVVIEAGSAVLMEKWKGSAASILYAWYPGMEGGNALADVLFGKVNPSGKLPFAIPVSEKHLPPFKIKADSAEYGLFHGYRLMERDGNAPAFAFGYGLSYTSFEIKNLRVDRRRISGGDAVNITVDVLNTGKVPGAEVIQIYTGAYESKVERPVKELKGFKKVSMRPGESGPVSFCLRAGELSYYDENNDRWALEKMKFNIYAGSSSRGEDLLETDMEIY